MDRRHQPWEPQVGKASGNKQIFNAGIYHYRLVADGKQQASGKIIIRH